MSIAFADEEGHYGSFVGSRSFTGLLEESEIDRLANRYHGKTLRQALEEAGLAGRPGSRSRRAATGASSRCISSRARCSRVRTEQVGVVTGIVAIWQYRITIEGQQDHAGGTTMAERRDAGLAAVRLLAWLDEEFPRHCGERTVWTAGRIALSPGAASIIPGRAEILFQFRDIDMEVLERLDGVLRRARAGEQPARALRGGAGGGEPVPPGALRPRVAGGARRRGGGACPGRMAAHALAAPGMTRSTSRACCPRRCCSCPRSAASATIGRRTPRLEDLAMGLRVLAEGARRFLAGQTG